MTEDPRNIRIQNYTYILPEEKIARYPLEKRDESKLLVYQNGTIAENTFRNLGAYLSEDDILVYNETRVIRARLLFSKATGATIEIFCLEPFTPSDYERNLSSVGPVEWQCLVGNRKKWKSGILHMEIMSGGKKVNLYAEEVRKMDKDSVLRFFWDNKSLSFSELLIMAGHVPVPPYLGRADEDIDKSRYQTVYSKNDGSVAAPTAGLHFTDGLISSLRKKGIRTAAITLHVGAGTFVPVKSETAGGHNMHIEYFSISRETIEQLSGRRIIAVGTTTLRTLESLYWAGHKISTGRLAPGDAISIEQWYPYDKPTNASLKKALDVILEFMDKNNLGHLEARTGIIIVPGYRVRVADGLITNFHLPGSTLLLLVAAFVGEDWKRIYDYSLRKDFRFLSYGDSSLLLP